MTVDLSPEYAAKWSRRAGLPLADDRLEAVSATANHVQKVLSVLRPLHLGETPSAPAYAAAEV
ncbi:hypothetical protein HUF15_25850 [Streptomyces samsunensis]|uniref:hypothetical protein n=1 Tax=Streptomyces malaysiensis TaxID=92644 RepID=UPI001581F3BC|nr:hypothetical protein [Streptomyces samsunensis]NUH40141.1 hypothetical protein [Streptomyces samsunensis]